jgi:exopolysaccharide production protein ExoZ
VGGYARPVLLPAWTLCYEILFYATVTIGLATGRWRLILAAFATCFVAEFFVGSALLSFIGNPLVLEFLMGVVIGRLAVNDWLVAALFVLACVVLALSPAYQFYDMPVETSGMIALSRVWWWGLPAAAIVLFALRLEREADFPRPLVYLGDVSYSFYLVHTLVVVPLETWNPLLKVALAVLAGIAAHEIFEKRLLNTSTSRKPLVAACAGSEVPVT